MAEQFADLNKSLWSSFKVTWPNTAKSVAAKIKANQSRYEKVTQDLIPWYIVGLIHYMEGNLSFSTWLCNGERIVKGVPTKLVPKGMVCDGTWEDAAIKSLKKDFMYTKLWTDIPTCLDNLERWNGIGYRSKGINSPYIWSGTDKYTKGKYYEVKNDQGVYVSKYDPNLVSEQIGCAAILRELL